MTYKIGILDQSPIFTGQTARDALASSIHLAQKAEAWGYERFWVAEHHQSADLAGSSPEVLISHLLAKTSSIKIGAGGVMLQHYSPYKVAENFHLLEALAPGRVELGIGKAPGGLTISTEALAYGGTGGDVAFKERLTLLQDFIDRDVPIDHPLHGAEAFPKVEGRLPTFLLGASVESARLAAEIGANFVFAAFLNGNEELLQEAVRTYRRLHPKGSFLIALAVYVAEDQRQAEEEASPYNIYKITFESGRSLSLASLDQVEQLWRETKEAFEVKKQEVKKLAGSPAFVKQEMERLAKKFQVDEFIVHTPVLDESKRLHSFELLQMVQKQYV